MTARIGFLGLVLLAGSLVYPRYQDRLKRSPDRS